MNIVCNLFILILISSLAGCSTLTGKTGGRLKDSTDRIEAQKILFQIKGKNNTLETFKGIGNAKLTGKSGTRIYRMAYSGTKQNKIRMVVLEGGQSVETFATDGKYFYLISHSNQHRFIKKRLSDSSLKRIISIPVKIEELIDLLSGRIPLYKYDEAILEKNNTASGYIIIMRKKWRGIVEKIFIDESKSKIKQFEKFNAVGQLSYRVSLSDVREVDGFTIPMKFKIATSHDDSFEFDVDRYWANTDVSESMFQLKPSD
ncbi:MAG: DUF4292 domain-containing protein [Desulfobacterales bacterium]|jgi:hypothetical protein|nr:DUF4292 domain-containing protein [Desulfobacteraceae bacterium]MBT4365685.1 DUF4292 domain-containing protein [Desulfobacteraceae bacterium]MBT7086325.1 DUF4292 domain-containing protein [Desulfobacterales bacterium]MBT7696732.1 DUF4292 domain-containing protein [Desulfobacterales bacterium]